MGRYRFNALRFSQMNFYCSRAYASNVRWACTFCSATIIPEHSTPTSQKASFAFKLDSIFFIFMSIFDLPIFNAQLHETSFWRNELLRDRLLNRDRIYHMLRWSSSILLLFRLALEATTLQIPLKDLKIPAPENRTRSNKQFEACSHSCWRGEFF